MAAQDALQKYQDMLKKRQEQDARLSELLPDAQTSGNTVSAYDQALSEAKQAQDILKLKAEEAKVNQLARKLNDNQFSDFNLQNPENDDNYEDVISRFLPKAPASVSGQSPLTPDELSQMGVSAVRKPAVEAAPIIPEVAPKKPAPIVIPKVQRTPEAPTKPISDTVSTTQAAPMSDEEKLAEAQRQRDIMAAMGLISGGISKAAAGYGGGSVTQLKADTTGQDLLTQMGERGVADIKESMARASDKKKQELEDLLKKAQAAKLQFEASGKMTDKEKADVAFKNAQLGLERLKLIQETTKPQKLSQDEINTRKENRKVYREVDADKTKSQSLLDEIKQARQAFEDYSKSKFGGTGPLATAFGTTANISEDSQKLRSKFNKLSLGNMTKLFSGFSKAIDTDAERAFFQSTQPDLSLDDDVNREILKNMEDYAKGLVDKANMRQAEITKEGDFRSPEETLSEYQKLAGKNTSYPKQMTKGGKQVTVSNSQEENEARQEGWN